MSDPRRGFRWQVLTVALLLAGYSGYYLCRSNLAVVTPALIEEWTAAGMPSGEARVQLGRMVTLGTLAYALGKFLGGPLGLHCFYLRGVSSTLGWLLPIPTALGLYGIERARTFGLDDSPRKDGNAILWYDTQEMAAHAINERVQASLQACPQDLRECLQSAMAGANLSFVQGLQLATADGTALDALVAVADHLRQETVGDAITYVVNRNINFTNVCFVGCSFCGFGRGPTAPDAYSLSFEEVVRRTREAWDRGATEICIQGGLILLL